MASIDGRIKGIREKLFEGYLARATKADTAAGDLAAGGMKKPKQGKPRVQLELGEEELAELEALVAGIPADQCPKCATKMAKRSYTVDEWTCSSCAAQFTDYPATVEAFKAEVAKPFAGYRDFDACVIDQKSKGNDEESARKICGSLQADAEKGEPMIPRQMMQQLTGEFDRMVASKVLKAAGPEEQRYALGIVLEPEVVDAQGDIYSAEEIRKAAWNYMTHFRNVGLMHKGFVNGKVDLVESYIAPTDMTVEGTVIKGGTWLLGLHVNDDELWAQIKSGGLTGLSIGGFAKKTPIS